MRNSSKGRARFFDKDFRQDKSIHSDHSQSWFSPFKSALINLRGDNERRGTLDRAPGWETGGMDEGVNNENTHRSVCRPNWSVPREKPDDKRQRELRCSTSKHAHFPGEIN